MINTDKELAELIDHTLLKPEATPDDIRQLAQEADTHGFCSICVLPIYVTLAAEILKNSKVNICTVIGFPLGATETKIKALETELAIEQGANEIDMVIQIGSLKSGQLEQVKSDIDAVVNVAQGKIVKVILETCLLNNEEKITACRLAADAGCDFIKTSTGFSSAGATLQDIRLIRETVGQDMGIKASGGIKDYETASNMIMAGATRLGTSSGLTIIGAVNNGSDNNY